MPIQAIRDLLVAAAPVTALVGQRISPQFREQGEPLPCITLTLVTTTPQNHLAGAPTLDQSRVQLDSWASTYAAAREVANACREALEAAGLVMESEFEEHEAEVEEYRVSQDFYIWL